MSEGQKTVAIVGAGIIGVATAIELQRAGHQVILFDAKGPAEGTSHGNGGVLAACSIVPVTGPGLWRRAPRMLLDPNQPLFLRWSYLPRLLPWLLKYMKHANATDSTRIAAALAPIVGESLADHQALSAGTGAERHLRPSDYLFLYNNRSHFEASRFGWDLRRQHGFRWEELEGPNLRSYDALFDADLSFAARLQNHGIITDPGQYVRDLAAHVVAKGGQIRRAKVTDFAHAQGKVVGVRAAGETTPCDAVVLAAGVWSGPLAAKLGISVPLEAERGYHLELWEPSAMPKAPAMVESAKCVVTPMEGRIRVAGIVEFGGLEAGPSAAPLDLLRAQLPQILPGVSWAHETHWLGHRPALADSIPVIGAVPGLAGVYLGFGHHHIGLTGGPKTARLLAQLVSGQTPIIDMTAYDPARFIT